MDRRAARRRIGAPSAVLADVQRRHATSISEHGDARTWAVCTGGRWGIAFELDGIQRTAAWVDTSDVPLDVLAHALAAHREPSDMTRRAARRDALVGARASRRCSSDSSACATTATSTEPARPIPRSTPSRLARRERAAVQRGDRLPLGPDLERLLDDRRRRRWIRAAAAPGARAVARAALRRREAPCRRELPRAVRASRAPRSRVTESTSSLRPSATVSIWAATHRRQRELRADGRLVDDDGVARLGRVALEGDGRPELCGPGPDWPSATLAAEGSPLPEFRYAP